MRDINYLELGATLYIPANHKELSNVIIKKRYPTLKSVVICLEDSISHQDVKYGMIEVKKLLKKLVVRDNFFIFIRPRHLDNLIDILKFDNINKIDGFSIPKISTTNIYDYMNLLENKNFWIMPILESIDVFNSAKLRETKNILDNYKSKILTIRVGGEDILNILDIRKDNEKSIYDYMLFNNVITNIINIFKPFNYNISSPVFHSFSEIKSLQKEIEIDISMGLFNKTVIHPSQIDIVHQSYRVDKSDVEIAKRLIQTSDAIISFNGAMYEKTTHINWAKLIIKRQTIYGTKE
ncbi:Citrate lyase beta chain [hydrothermal vent metagenome]|uniref:Citrate lyase beta chain n=1 Tax=hydrothermal vent metagenome TaxID=652676 RepID=A0A1W1ELB6_9ZZZZ